MTDTRHKNVRWTVHTNAEGRTSYEGAQLAVLMDIRDELQTLNRLLGCANAVAIPEILRGIRRNTAKRKRKAVKP
jgi:hypothetical protein